MTTTFRRAERRRAKLRLGISGAAGSGKTYSALLIAFGLGGKDRARELIDGWRKK